MITRIGAVFTRIVAVFARIAAVFTRIAAVFTLIGTVFSRIAAVSTWTHELFALPTRIVCAVCGLTSSVTLIRPLRIAMT